MDKCIKKLYLIAFGGAPDKRQTPAEIQFATRITLGTGLFIEMLNAELEAAGLERVPEEDFPW